MRRTLRRWRRQTETTPRTEARNAFDPRFLARLDRARFVHGRVSGWRPGETAVPGPGQASGIEIESYRPYSPGDDIRHVDWLAFARLEQLYTRRFIAEREIPLHVLVDASASMGVPEGASKLGLACAIAAGIAYVGLRTGDAVRVAALRREGTELRVEESRQLRHRGRLLELEPFLTGLEASGETALREGTARYLGRHREPGVAFILSDFLAPDAEVADALLAFRVRGLETRAILVTSAVERELAGLRGRLEIRDVETGATREVTLSDRERRRYREAFEKRTQGLRDFCHRHGIGIAMADTARGAEPFLLEDLPAEGLLRLA